MAEANGLSICRQDERHNLRPANFMWTTHEPVYWDSSVGKTENLSLVRRLRLSLQQRFRGYRKAGLAVSVDDLPAPFAPV